jgi:TetR/AcrR family transcriptional regulator, copper-responsive repressor
MVQKSSKRARGRPRTYEPERALAQVTDAFWLAGFSATSLDDLSAATGMNRPSLYAAFGDKRALYLKTLELYVERGRRGIEEALAGDGSAADALRRVYERALSLYLPQAGRARGCLLIGTAATEAMSDGDVKHVLAEGLRQFDRAFEARFTRAQSAGELDARADPASLAKIASAILHTLAIRSRAGDSRASLEAIAENAVVLIFGNGSFVLIFGSGSSAREASKPRK